MNWRQAFDELKALVAASAPVVAHSIPVLDGVQAEMVPESMAEIYEGTFTDAPFTALIMHPAASLASTSGREHFFTDAYHLYIVENPTQRSTAALDPLEIPRTIAMTILGAPGRPGSRDWRPAADFYAYRGEARGFLFHRFTFLIMTDGGVE